MPRNLFSRIFPLPKYLVMPPVGVDLSDRSLKYCRQLKVFGERAIPAGAIEGGRIKNSAAVVEVLRAAAKDFGTKYVAVALPEEPGFTFILSLPAAARENLRQSVELQLEEHIPLPASGIIFDYEVLREPTAADPKFKLAVSAFPKNLALEYAKIFAAAGLILVAFESEAQATTRALFPPTAKGSTLVIDLGETHTSFFVIVDNLCVLTSTVAEISSDFLTKAIEKGLGTGKAEAEELKNKRGLLQNQDHSLIDILLPVISVLHDEANRFMSYWNTEVGEEGRGSQGLPAVSQVILSGGQAVLPGLAEYLSARLGLEVKVGNVWANVLNVKLSALPLNLSQSARQAVTIGLALRPLTPTINLLPEESLALIRSEYRHRRSVVLGIFLLAWLLMLSLIMTAFYVLARIDKRIIADQLALKQRRLSETETAGLTAEFTRLAGELKTIKTAERSRVLPFDFLQQVLAVKPPAVKIDNLAFADSAIDLSGLAGNRQELLTFLERLRGNPALASVDSPVSNLIKESNVNFHLKLRLKSLKP